MNDTVNSNIEDLTVGPDGNLWFTNRGNTQSIGRITPSGTITETTSGLDPMASMPNGITVGGDRRLWFTDEGSLTMAGTGGVGNATTAATPTVTESPNNIQTAGRPDAITTGPDGTVWFEDNLGGNEAIGRISMPSGSVTEFKNGLTKAAQDDITAGADGNIWVEQSMPGGIARITPTGVITEFTSGLLPNAGSDGDGFTTGPDGNLWFNDLGAKAIGKVSLELPATATTGTASAITTSSATVSGTVEPFGAPTAVTFQYGTTPALGSTVSAGTLAPSTTSSPVTAGLSGLPAGKLIYYRVVANNGSGTASGAIKTFTTVAGPPPPPPPPKGQTTQATLGNQQITLTTPSLLSCTASTRTLSATLSSTTIATSRNTKLRFVRAAFYLDKGVKHTHKRVRHLAHGHKKTVTVVVYTANATVHLVPATVGLRLGGLKSGTHTLKVVVAYKRSVWDGHWRTRP